MTAILETSGRILVVRGGAIGDFVLTLPVLFALREAKFRVSVVGPSVVAPLAVAGGLADEWCSLDGREWAGMFAERGGCDSDLSDWLAGFELVLSYLHDPDGILERNLKRVTMARLVRGAYRPDGIHVVDRLMQPLGELGIEVGVDGFRLAVPKVELPGAGTWLAVHPGSGSERKNWPEENWRVLMGRVMLETDWKVFLIGGEAELGRVGCLAEGLPPNRICRAENWPLIRVAGALRCCDIFAGVDSGIRHLAEAVGLPGVAGWSGSNLTEWGPLSDGWIVLDHTKGEAEVEDMLAELITILTA